MPAIPNNNGPKKPITIATCMPTQQYDRQSKLDWLDQALADTDCDLFITPQEYVGGHYIMKNDLHMDRQWVIDSTAELAVKHGKHIAIGACCKTADSGATEDLLIIDDQGQYLGHRSKYALPSYDDVRTNGHGALWPETDFNRRVAPIEVPKLRLKVGVCFCWEVFSQLLWPAYSLARVNLVIHPIKFSPTGWLKNQMHSDGKKHIVDFGNAPKSTIWGDRLVMASRHQVMCPIAVSCNSWNLGDKFMALVGHVDEITRTTDLHRVPSIGKEQYIHSFQMLPEIYSGLDHMHSAGAFKAHTGTVDNYSQLGEHKMHIKIRRLEAQLMGGTTKLDCQLKATAISRQKKSSVDRAFGKKQTVKLRRK